METRKVLIITYYWPPCGGAAVQRWLKMSRYLTDLHIEPVVVTVNDKIASYPLYDETLTNEVTESIQVYRTGSIEPLSLYKMLKKNKKIPHSGFANETNPNFIQKVARFIRGNLFIPDARVLWNIFAYRKCVDIIRKQKITAIITNSPPHSTQLIGLKLKRKFGIPWIADFRDPWTDIFYYNQLYHTGLAKMIDKRFERKVIEKADIITVVGSSLSEDLAKKTGKPVASKFRIVPNGFSPDDFALKSNPPEDLFRITFTGSLSLKYDISNAIKAISEVILYNSDIPVRIMFVGEVDSKVDREFEKYGIKEHIERIGFVPHKEVLRLMKNSTAMLLAIYPSAKNKALLSAKVFEYLAVRKPILCIGPEDGEVSGIIRECNAGKVFDYNNYEGVKLYFQQMLDQWKLNSNLDIHDDSYLKYSRKEQAKQIAEIIGSFKS